MIFGYFDPKMMIFGHNLKNILSHVTCFDPKSNNDPKTMIFGHFDPKMMIFGHFDSFNIWMGVIWGIFNIWMGNN